jgi:hypothetical protein
MTRKTDLIAMAEKLETASEPNSLIFEDAWQLIYDLRWCGQLFIDCCNISAWTSAAEMLVPEGYCIVRIYQNPDGVSDIYLNSHSGENATGYGGSIHFALALAAASCRAWAEMCDD